MSKKKRLYRHVHNSTVSICVNYIILITQNIYFFILRIYILYAKKKRLYRHVHNSTVSFCVNYIILTPQNIYFFISQNIYFVLII